MLKRKRSLLSMGKIDIRALDSRTIILNLYLTQIITLSLALLLYYIIYGLKPIEIVLSLYPTNFIKSFQFGLIFAIIIVTLNIILTKKLPKELIDDGGINKKIFKNMPIWHIALISVTVGFTEELLFRGAIQSFIGFFWTSFLFTLIHFRYLRKVVLITITFLTSIGLGILVVYIDWFAAFTAHVIIDFLLGFMLKKKWV